MHGEDLGALQRTILFALGAHVIKCGLGTLSIDKAEP
jgi:hypothetical protein